MDNIENVNISDSTIAAVSTPPGRGGLAVIRISGKNAVDAASRFFVLRGGGTLADTPDRYACYGDIISLCAESNGTSPDIIDTGLATVFRGPRSYTGEDVVEISCHGGTALTYEVLATAFKAGCVPAGPGEFTRRAFMNGKLSLTEAEAVIGLIDAESSQAVRLSASHSRGVLRRKIESLANDITALTASMYAYIDYPDEDMTDVTAEELHERVTALVAELRRLADTYRIGHAVCEGIPTVILGKPNVGKSSLLNALLGRKRAIVTDIPGTTRDTVEETVNIDGVMLRLCDTAGIREPQDEVERIGTQLSVEKASEAELIFGMFDASRPLDKDDHRSAELICSEAARGAEAVILLNKCDGEKITDTTALSALLPDFPILQISAKSGEGVDLLYKKIKELFNTEAIAYKDNAVLSNARQYNAVSAALGNMEAALSALDSGFTPDVAGLDLEAALASLGETDGRSVTENVVSEIFSRFCVGK